MFVARTTTSRRLRQGKQGAWDCGDQDGRGRGPGRKESTRKGWGRTAHHLYAAHSHQTRQQQAGVRHCAQAGGAARAAASPHHFSLQRSRRLQRVGGEARGRQGPPGRGTEQGRRRTVGKAKVRQRATPKLSNARSAVTERARGGEGGQGGGNSAWCRHLP